MWLVFTPTCRSFDTLAFHSIHTIETWGKEGLEHHLAGAIFFSHWLMFPSREGVLKVQDLLPPPVDWSSYLAPSIPNEISPKRYTHPTRCLQLLFWFSVGSHSILIKAGCCQLPNFSLFHSSQPISNSSCTTLCLTILKHFPVILRFCHYLSVYSLLGH